jgi:serine/threonine-protein kinase
MLEARVAEDFPAGLADSGSPPQVGSYQMVEEIGRGGMAIVYRARDVRLGRWVALKVLAEDLARDEGFRRRFIRESRAAAAVDHPNIIPIFDAGEAGGVLFIAMRYVGGQDVHSLLNRAGPLPAARATGIVTQVASALDAAHASGLVHRDVKPANMLLGGLAEDGSEDHVYLSDFGISKTSQATTNLTLTGQVLGTLNYLAPEQIEGRTVDGRADAYSLACAAFEMLSGAPPFRRDQSLAVMWAQLSAPPPPLTGARPDLPAAVDQVIFRGLAKDPEDRYPSCRAFAAALQEACGVSAAELPARSAVQQALAGVPPTGAVSPPPGLAPPGPDQAGPAAAEAGEPETTPVSPAAGFLAPPRPAAPTSADGLHRVPPAGGGPPGAPSPASMGAPSMGAPSMGAPSMGAPSMGPSSMGPAPLASADLSGLRPAPPPQRPGPSGPGRLQPPRRRRGLAVLAACVAVLAVVGIGLALLKHHNSLLQHQTTGGTVASSPPATGRAVAVPVTPSGVVRRYYAAISRHAYLRAWDLGGNITRPSLAQFEAGYRGTARDVVTILTATGDQVTADVVAFQTDGTVKKYSGSYVVQNGVITSFSVRQVG